MTRKWSDAAVEEPIRVSTDPGEVAQSLVAAARAAYPPDIQSVSFGPVDGSWCVVVTLTPARSAALMQSMSAASGGEAWKAERACLMQRIADLEAVVAFMDATLDASDPSVTA